MMPTRKRPPRTGVLDNAAAPLTAAPLSQPLSRLLPSIRPPPTARPLPRNLRRENPSLMTDSSGLLDYVGALQNRRLSPQARHLETVIQVEQREQQVGHAVRLIDQREA
ncbi:hypothetical protein D3C87_1527980 [compost metagenome]